MQANTLLFFSILVGFGLSGCQQADDYQVPQNSWGQPDIGGVWSNGTTTPFERPEEFGDQLILTEEQAAKIQGAAEDYRDAGNVATDPNAPKPQDKNTSAGYNRFWTDPGTQVMRVNGEPRSSSLRSVPERAPTDRREISEASSNKLN